MASSSNDTEGRHVAHTTKPFYASSDFSFTDEEKRVIVSLTLIKHKPVVFKRSKLPEEDTHYAGHVQVGTIISSHPQMVNHNIRFCHAQVEALSGSPIEIENPNAGFSLWRGSGRQIYEQKKNYFELKDEDEPEAEVFLRIRREKVQKDICHHGASIDDNGIENPKTRVSHERADINDNGKRVGGQGNQNGKDGRGRPRKKGQAIGVCDYQRSGRYEANIWLKKEKRQIHLGQYFIAEAAARSSDKAMLVTRIPADRKLNYPEADYDTKLIEEWRKVFNEDVNTFLDVLREQSRMYSEGSIEGLNDEAAFELLQLIDEKKKAELRQ